MSKPLRAAIITTKNKDGVTHVTSYNTESDSLICVATVQGGKVTRTYYTELQIKVHIEALREALEEMTS